MFGRASGTGPQEGEPAVAETMDPNARSRTPASISKRPKPSWSPPHDETREERGDTRKKAGRHKEEKQEAQEETAGRDNGRSRGMRDRQSGQGFERLNRDGEAEGDARDDVVETGAREERRRVEAVDGDQRGGERKKNADVAQGARQVRPDKAPAI